MVDENKRMQILEMIERGEITSDEGLRLLQEVNNIDAAPAAGSASPDGETSAGFSTHSAGVEVEPPEVEIITEQELRVEEGNETTSTYDHVESSSSSYSGTFDANAETDSTSEDIPASSEAEVYSQPEQRSMPEGADKWRRWWMIPLYIGIGITVLAGLFMLWAFQASGMGFWFMCSSTFLALGLVILVLAAQSRTARWLHLRVKQRPGERPATIAISFPLPLRFASWMIRIFGGFIPDVEGASANDILIALDAVDETVTFENPIYIEVDDEDGERVEIYIG